MVAQTSLEWDDDLGMYYNELAYYSPLEGESRKPNRQVPADAVGGRS